MKEKKLLPKGYGSKKLGQTILGFWAYFVKNDCKSCIDQEIHGNCRVFKVVKMVGGDGSIIIKRLVFMWAYEEFHGNGGKGSSHDYDELHVLEFGGGKPWWSSVGVGLVKMELDVIK